MSSGIYRSPSFQERCRVMGLRRPASMIAPPRSGGARAVALKRRTVHGGEVMRGPTRIESMPNMRNGVDVSRRHAKRRQRASAEPPVTTGAPTKCPVIDASRKLRTKMTKTATVRYSAVKSTDAEEDYVTPPTTSGSSSVVVDIEATPTVDRTSLPPPPPRSDSPTSASTTCLQSPVNNSGVRIVIDSDNDDDSRPLWSPTEAEFDDVHRRRVPDGPETDATPGSASVTSGSGDDDSSNVVVLFQCGPSDDVDDDGIVGSTV